MPVEVPFRLRYPLSRRQRLVPLLRFWGLGWVLFATVMELFFLVETALAVWMRSFFGIAVMGGLALAAWLLYRGMFLGLLNAAFVPVMPMDVIVEENAAGLLAGGERWYLFLDGITSLRQYCPDVWTVQHWNGSVFHIAADAITEEQLDHLRAGMECGRTPEGIQAVIERGRRIEQIWRDG
jgi:hypothetical protein